MKVRSLLLLLPALLLVSCSSLPGQDPGPTSAPEKRAEKKDPSPAKQTSIPSIPFAEGQEVTYQWSTKGEKTGQSRFSWKQIVADDGTRLVEISSRFEFEAAGRRLYLAGKTLLTQSLEPVRYEHTMRTFASPNYKGGRKITAVFEEGTVKVKLVQLADGKTSESQMELEPPVYLAASQSIEHWALLAARLPALGSCKLDVFTPSACKNLEIEFTRHDPSEEKVPHPKGWIRWTSKHPTFNTTLWLSKDGILQRQEQGDTAIELMGNDKKLMGNDKK